MALCTLIAMGFSNIHLLAVAASTQMGSQSTPAAHQDCSAGMLVVLSEDKGEIGRCTLQHTEVKADVSGYIARVTVRQRFKNPFHEKIDARYTFPLPHDSAVDEMTMAIGDLKIRGAIKEHEEARALYDLAIRQGRAASLLDQERPNIFTQSVANIEPGKEIDIEIKYVSLLPYENGTFTFVFPTTIGARFSPPNMKDAANLLVQDTLGLRNGRDISISLNVNAGVPIRSISSKLHSVELERPFPNKASLRLKNEDAIPNRDFVARWNVSSNSIQSGYLVHKHGDEGFFTLMILPPEKVIPSDTQAKELIFLIDCSGSQKGRPIEKAKEALLYILEHMNPQDTFQIITFNNTTEALFKCPQTANEEMKRTARSFIERIDAHGGTWMKPAVAAVCQAPNEDHKLRIVTFMTDGFVGNDMEVLNTIKRFRGQSRWFSFGTGNNVNRFLIDGIATEGGGEAEYVYLESSAEEVGKRFYDRISSPVLTDLSIDVEGLNRSEVFPDTVSDVWAQRPLYLLGKYSKAMNSKVTLRGYAGNKPYKQALELNLPQQETANPALPFLWARAKVEQLMSKDWLGIQNANNEVLKKEITDVALKYHIMSQFTSFVAVDPRPLPKGSEASRNLELEPPTQEVANRLETTRTQVQEGTGFNNAAQDPGTVQVRAYQERLLASMSFSDSPFRRSGVSPLVDVRRSFKLFSKEEIISLLNFKKTPLKQVFDELGKRANIEFVCDESISKIEITEEYKDCTIKEIIDAIVDKYKLRLKVKQNNRVEVSKQ